MIIPHFIMSIKSEIYVRFRVALGAGVLAAACAHAACSPQGTGSITIPEGSRLDKMRSMKEAVSTPKVHPRPKPGPRNSASTVR
jgi:hypothetical protein